MEKKLREQFLPLNYTQSLYKDLHNLKQEGSVEVFHQLVIRVELNESEEQMVARYLSGLKPSIQESLALNHYGTCRKPSTGLYWWRSNKLG